MLETYLNKIIKTHIREGNLLEANYETFFNGHKMRYNAFTLRFQKWSESSLGNLSYYNACLLRKIQKNSALYKEIREFQFLFRFFEKLHIKDGYLMKRESPDFVLKQNGKQYGIEVTRIYTGNDWAAERVHTDIEALRLNQAGLTKYAKEKKFGGKIKIYKNQNKIVVKAIKDQTLKEEEITQIKNKLFEKIRKQMDEYTKFDGNYIFAEIVFTGYQAFSNLHKLNEEIHYFVSHLDVSFGNSAFHLFLKTGNVWTNFDLKTGQYEMI